MEVAAKTFNNEVYDDSGAAGARVTALQGSDEGITKQFSVVAIPLR